MDQRVTSGSSNAPYPGAKGFLDAHFQGTWQRTARKARMPDCVFSFLVGLVGELVG